MLILGRVIEAAILDWDGTIAPEFLDVPQYLFEGVANTLRTLHQGSTKLAICSVRQSEQIFQAVVDFGLEDELKIIRGSCWKAMGERTNDRVIADICCELGVRPEKSVYIGDQEMDVRLANANKLLFIGVLTGRSNRADFQRFGVPDDQVILSLCELWRLSAKHTCAKEEMP